MFLMSTIIFDFFMELHEILRNIRESKRLRQAPFAKKIGVSPQIYQKYETGSKIKSTGEIVYTEPGIDFFRKLFSAFEDLDANIFFRGNKLFTPTNTICLNCQKLSDELTGCRAIIADMKNDKMKEKNTFYQQVLDILKQCQELQKGLKPSGPTGLPNDQEEATQKQLSGEVRSE